MPLFMTPIVLSRCKKLLLLERRISAYLPNEVHNTLSEHTSPPDFFSTLTKEVELVNNILPVLFREVKTAPGTCYWLCSAHSSATWRNTDEYWVLYGGTFPYRLTHLCPPLHSTFAVRETALNPLKPLRDDSALRALSTLTGLRGTPAVPPLCRETQSLGQQMLNATVGINGLNLLVLNTRPAR